ncbi:1129_t:CDS:2 [Funneliformis geosporum]|uniref:5314_t:CDS:1 n=1 Tax=Funneliformis geosporum TaxID=1117311 RepID=A0A9W4SIH5_9GLOM|nr:1129_t:CDS:2 [Funneliformis geosporum]CAI2170670.1 5314_t:CDS:2 [Funneliformis geosporum]
MLHLFSLQDSDKTFEEFKMILKGKLVKCFECVKVYHKNKRELFERYKMQYNNDEGVDVMFSLIKSWDEQRVEGSFYYLRYLLGLKKETCDDFVVLIEIFFDISLLQNHKINEMFSKVMSIPSPSITQILSEEFPPSLFLASVHENEDVRKVAWNCMQITWKGSDLESNWKNCHKNEHYQLFKELLKYYLHNDWGEAHFDYPITKKEALFLAGITKILCILDSEKLHNLIYENNEFDIPRLLAVKFKYNKSLSTFIEIIRFLRALLCKLKDSFWFNSTEFSHFDILRSIMNNNVFCNVMESTKSETTKKATFDLLPTFIDSLRDYNENEFYICISIILKKLLCSFQKSNKNVEFSLMSLKMALKIIKDFDYSIHPKLYKKFQKAIDDRLGIFHKNLPGTEREKIINEILKYVVEDQSDDQINESIDGSIANPIVIESVPIKRPLETSSSTTSSDSSTTNDSPSTPKNSTVLTTTKEQNSQTVEKIPLKTMPRKPISWNPPTNGQDVQKGKSTLSKLRASFIKEQKEKFEIEQKAKEEREKYAKIDEDRRKAQNLSKISKSNTSRAISLSRSTSGNGSSDSVNSREAKRLKSDNDESLNHSKPKLRKFNPPPKQRQTKMLDLSEVIKHQSLYQQRAVANKRRKDNLEKRLKPNLNNLYKQVLSWGLESKGELPPSTSKDQYLQIQNTFESVEQYIKIFEPLLILECWQSFVQSKEDLDMENDKYDALLIESIASIDDFQELSCKIIPDKMKNIAEGDLIIVKQNISKDQDKGTSVTSKMFLAIVKSIMNHERVTLFCYLQNNEANIRSELRPGTNLIVYRIMSLTPPKREYAALVGLPYFQYKDMILNPKGQISSSVPENELVEYMTNYRINQSQAEAVHKVIQQKNGFSLIQGPPGTGKTSTILGIISALRNVSDKRHKILACAPSNAAVDELERRLRQGIYNSDGKIVHLNVVRFGKLDNSEKDPNSPEGEQKLKLERYEKKLRGLHKKRHETRNGWDLSKLDAEIDQTNAEIGKIHETLRNLKAEQQNLNHLSKRGNLSNADLIEADVVCATLAGSGHETFANIGIQFSTVIVDEAAQAIELNTLIPLKYNANRIILVGDPNQLPPTVLSQIATTYLYEQSLFVRFQRCFPEAIHLLNTQYRMHPEISRFPSRLFYNNALLDAPELGKKKRQIWHNSNIFGPYRFFDVEGRMNRDKKKSSYNTDEACIAVKLFLTLVNKFETVDFKDRVGIVTPYKRQLIELRTKFRQLVPESYYNRIEFNTVDGFQGREKDIIIFSCVRVGEDKGIGFLQDIRRMNVALTRAKSSLFILGNKAALESNSQWNELIQDAIQRGLYTDVSVKEIGLDLHHHHNYYY